MSEENQGLWRPRKAKFLVTGIVAVVIIIGIAVGAGKGKTQNTSPATAANSSAVNQGADKDLIPIRTPTRKNCTLAPILVADRQGFFAAEGLKLVFTGELQQPQILPSILNGNNDFADAHPNYLALARSGGAKVVGVARSIIEPGPDKDPKLRHMRYFVNPQSGITSFADLKKLPDAKIKFSATSKNSCPEFLGNKIADNTGIGRDRIEWVVMPDIQAVQAAKQGLITVADVHPPFYKAAEDAGLTLIGDSSDANYGEAAGLYLYYFSEDFVKKNPDTVKRFVRAITKAQIWANEHPEQTAKWTEEFSGVPVAGNHYYASTSKIDEEQIVPWVEDLETNGALNKGQVKPSDLITHAFE